MSYRLQVCKYNEPAHIKEIRLSMVVESVPADTELLSNTDGNSSTSASVAYQYMRVQL